jgi:hypothetical protein
MIIKDCDNALAEDVCETTRLGTTCSGQGPDASEPGLGLGLRPLACLRVRACSMVRDLNPDEVALNFYHQPDSIRFVGNAHDMTTQKRSFLDRLSKETHMAHLQEVKASEKPQYIRFTRGESCPLHIPSKIRDMVELDSTCSFASSLLALIYVLKKPFFVSSASL